MIVKKIGFGGGCHWCTEAYFQSLKGVEKVEQGWISSTNLNSSFSEAVIVHYNPIIIPLNILIAIHLHTHASTVKHSFREKYRSAVYVFDDKTEEIQKIIYENQVDFKEKNITEALPFHEFKSNIEKQQDYYKKNKEGVFCKRYISPKLQFLEKKYSNFFQKLSD